MSDSLSNLILSLTPDDGSTMGNGAMMALLREQVPTGRGRGDRCDDPGHPCLDPSIASAAVRCLTLKLPECERKRQGRFVRRAEELVQHGRLKRDPRSAPDPSDRSVQMNAARRLRHETLDRQAKSGDHTVMRRSTWGMSAEKDPRFENTRRSHGRRNNSFQINCYT